MKFSEEDKRKFGSKNVRNRFDTASLARSIDMAINELGWKGVVKAKFMEGHATWLLALELRCFQGHWEISTKIEENHVTCDVNEAASIQRAHKQQKLEHQLTPLHRETHSGAEVKNQ